MDETGADYTEWSYMFWSVCVVFDFFHQCLIAFIKDIFNHTEERNFREAIIGYEIKAKCYRIVWLFRPGRLLSKSGLQDLFQIFALWFARWLII